MGDENRGIVFAQFIAKQFPKAKLIADVAGGKGQVARKLANKKRDVIVIDPSPRFQGRSHRRIRYISDDFTESYSFPTKPDLIVGMHPDEATAEIIGYAVKNRVPFAIVPCCVRGRHSRDVQDYWGWLSKLKAMAQEHFHVHEATLGMSGKNIILVGKPR